MRHAVRSTSRRNCSSWIHESAIIACTSCLRASVSPWVDPRQRPLAHHVERLLDQPDGAHGVVDAAAAEAGLGDDEARRRGRRGGGRRGCARRCSGCSCACPCPRRGRRRRRCAGSRRRACRPGRRTSTAGGGARLVGIGDGEQDEERGEVGVRREPLLAVDHPLVAVELGAGRRSPSGRSRRAGSVIEYADTISLRSSGSR